MKLPAYPRTKPSGVEWLGNVPEHWTVVPFKHRCRRFAIYGANMSSDEYVPDGVRFLRTTDIDELGQLQPEGVFIEPEQAREYLLNDQDILLSRSGTLGRAFVYRSKIHPACAYAGYLVRFVPTARLNTRFLFHFTKSIAFTDWLQTQIIASTIGNVNGQKYAQCPLPLPEREEQDLIAAFLDRETGRVDRLVAKKRELIERLKEKRTALISRAVTRGLPPAAGSPNLQPPRVPSASLARAAGLPENPPLKPSGIEWLGEIPKHWEVAQLRRKAHILDCKHRTVPFIDDGIPLASIREVHGFEVDLTNAKQTSEEEYLTLIEGDRRPRLGDIIYSRNATVGDAALVTTKERFCMGQDVCLIRAPKHHAKFLLYLFRSPPLMEQVESLMIGSTFRRINVGQIHAFWICLPPLPEQAAIAAYLDLETAKLDALVGKVEEAVERLQEYRTALITAAVTGKIDVRTVKP